VVASDVAHAVSSPPTPPYALDGRGGTLPGGRSVHRAIVIEPRNSPNSVQVQESSVSGRRISILCANNCIEKGGRQTIVSVAHTRLIHVLETVRRHQ